MWDLEGQIEEFTRASGAGSGADESCTVVILGCLARLSGMNSNQSWAEVTMALRWFGSTGPDEIDKFFEKRNMEDPSIVFTFLKVCGLCGVASWFWGTGFYGGVERGIPLAACVLIYMVWITQRLQNAEARARLIEIDGKLGLIERDLIIQKEEREKTNTMLTSLHGRLKDNGDVGRKLEQINEYVNDLRFAPGLETYFEDRDEVM